MIIKPLAIQASNTRLAADGVYLIDNGLYIYMYIKAKVPNTFCMDILGYEDFGTLQYYGVTFFQPTENDASQRVQNVISQLQTEKNGAYQQVRVMLQG